MEGQKRTGLLALLAGVGLIAAAIPTWFELTDSSGTEVIKGTDSTAGMGTLGLGAIVLVAAIVLYVRGPVSGGKASSWVITVAAAFALLASGYSVASPGDAIASFESSGVAELYGISDDEAEFLIKQAVNSGELEVEAKTGAMLAIAPSVLGLIAGITGIRNAKKRAVPAAPAAPAPAAAPPPAADASTS